jgi:hypothetical protein
MSGMMNLIDNISIVNKIIDLRANGFYSIKKIKGSRSSKIKCIIAALILCLLLGMNVPHVTAGEVPQLNYFPTWDGGIILSIDASGISYHDPSDHLFIVDAEINVEYSVN